MGKLQVTRAEGERCREKGRGGGVSKGEMEGSKEEREGVGEAEGERRRFQPPTFE